MMMTLLGSGVAWRGGRESGRAWVSGSIVVLLGGMGEACKMQIPRPPLSNEVRVFLEVGPGDKLLRNLAVHGARGPLS